MLQDHGIVFDNEPGVAKLSEVFEHQPPQEILEWAIDRFDDKLAFVTSFQTEGMVILDMASRITSDIRVVTIDTGRLHEETYGFIEHVSEYYGFSVEVHFPDSSEIQKMSTTNGVNLFYRDLESRLMCCQVRKVNPLLKILENVDAWVTGLRREQSLSRSGAHKIELDYERGETIKLNPLVDWTSEQVRNYVTGHNVPQHPLYQRGYASIGCAPCTRPLQNGENARAGRWWWEGSGEKECGMHCRI
jgi:thioredoxin-dependent adenylylsulfate APS reductase